MCYIKPVKGHFMSQKVRVFRMGEDKHRVEAEYNGVMYSAVVDPKRETDPLLVQTIRVIGEKGNDIVPDFGDWNSIMVANLQRYMLQMYNIKKEEVKSHFGDWDGSYAPSH